MRQRRFLAVDQAQLALEMEVAHRNAHQISSSDLAFDADLGHQRHTFSHAHETLDGLQRGQFHVHMQGSFVAAERLNHLVAIRRGDNVGDE